MPTYSYRCTSCGEEFDIVQSFSDDPLSRCPRCEGPLRKLYNAVGVVFKGSGFYRTDSRGSSSGSSTSSGPSSSTSSGGTSSTSGSGGSASDSSPSPSSTSTSSSSTPSAP